MSLDLVREIIACHPHRSLRLFSEFLPRGYRLTALRDVAGTPGEQLLRAKVLLGALITFQDDLADHPGHFDPEALDFIYGLTPTPPRGGASRERVRVAGAIAAAFWAALAALPHYERYARLLRFDFDQFCSANRYGVLLRLHDGLGNVAESRHFGPFNMGMVAAGTIDLMALGPLAPADLSAVREAVFLGQRAARISNVVTTLGRERAEGDLTNEALIAAARGDGGAYLDDLGRERAALVAAIQRLADRCAAVDLRRYGRAIEALHGLHLEFEGAI